MAPEDLPYADAAELADHWWWRPGWRVGTRFLTWHLTLHDQPGLRALVAAYQAPLRGLAEFDAVPAQWLHVTVQGVGHDHELPPAERDRVVSAVRSRLARVQPPDVRFSRPVLHREAVVVPPTDPGPLRLVRQEIRRGIATALGPALLPEGDDYRPHVSVAYVNAPAETHGVRAALDAVDAAPVTARFARASLIELHRDDRRYEWRVVAEAPLGGTA